MTVLAKSAENYQTRSDQNRPDQDRKTTEELSNYYPYFNISHCEFWSHATELQDMILETLLSGANINSIPDEAGNSKRDVWLLEQKH
jgi:hypothetical protein